MSEFNWVCPFCQNDQTVTKEKYHSQQSGIVIGESKYGRIGARLIAIGCSNPKCKDVQISLVVGTDRSQNYGYSFDLAKVISSHILWPESSHKPLPNYIPAPIVQDYIEASRIRDLSPKASATLARRCIQGMIHDFCGISKATLFKEIEELSSRIETNSAPLGVTHETVEAIDHLRSIGNIGAHMGKDINVIVDVDVGEAQALIDLIELLFEEWYVARNSRQVKLAKIKTIAEEKAEAKKVVDVKLADAGSAT